eukprot:279440-Pelagomonas_calceolata.AAC.1
MCCVLVCVCPPVSPLASAFKIRLHLIPIGSECCHAHSVVGSQAIQAELADLPDDEGMEDGGAAVELQVKIHPRGQYFKGMGNRCRRPFHEACWCVPWVQVHKAGTIRACHGCKCARVLPEVHAMSVIVCVLPYVHAMSASAYQLPMSAQRAYQLPILLEVTEPGLSDLSMKFAAASCLPAMRATNVLTNCPTVF